MRTNRYSFVAPFLDRLLGHSSLPFWEGEKGLAQLKESIRRDLEWLLNNRRSAAPTPESYWQLDTSIVAAGLPDLPSIGIERSNRVEIVAEMIRSLVVRFEPRLQQVRVEFETSGGAVVEFRIFGVLVCQGLWEDVTYGTELRISLNDFSVKGT